MSASKSLATAIARRCCSPADDYDTLQDMIAVFSDAELLAGHRAGLAAIAAGDHRDAEQLTAAMGAADRLPR